MIRTHFILSTKINNVKLHKFSQASDIQSTKRSRFVRNSSISATSFSVHKPRSTSSFPSDGFSLISRLRSSFSLTLVFMDPTILPPRGRNRRTNPVNILFQPLDSRGNLFDPLIYVPTSSRPTNRNYRRSFYTSTDHVLELYLHKSPSFVRVPIYRTRYRRRSDRRRFVDNLRIKLRRLRSRLVSFYLLYITPRRA